MDVSSFYGSSSLVGRGTTLQVHFDNAVSCVEAFSGDTALTDRVRYISHNYIGVSGPHACSRYPDERPFSSMVVNVEQPPSASGQAHHSGKSAFQNGRDGVEESPGRYLYHHPKT